MFPSVTVIEHPISARSVAAERRGYQKLKQLLSTRRKPCCIFLESVSFSITTRGDRNAPD